LVEFYLRDVKLKMTEEAQITGYFFSTVKVVD
jgi:hypothetical protein